MHGADIVKTREKFPFPSISVGRALLLTGVKPHQQRITEASEVSDVNTLIGVIKHVTITATLELTYLVRSFLRRRPPEPEIILRVKACYQYLQHQ